MGLTPYLGGAAARRQRLSRQGQQRCAERAGLLNGKDAAYIIKKPICFKGSLMLWRQPG